MTLRTAGHHSLLDARTWKVKKSTPVACQFLEGGSSEVISCSIVLFPCLVVPIVNLLS